MLLLFEENRVLKTLLIKRSGRMKHHSGEIALPGGRIENNETIIDAALRETYEETGISPEKINVLGELSNFYIEVSKFLIHPIVGWLNSKTELKTNPDEVEKVISFPVEKIKPPYTYIEIATQTGQLTVPCIYFEDEIIWGATAMILSEFYDLSATLFNHKKTMKHPAGM